MAVAPTYAPIRGARRVPALPAAAALLNAAHRLAALSLTPSYGPGDHGNLSVRVSGGILMSARESRKAVLRLEDVVFVRAVEGPPAAPRVVFDGARLPSTDALMHWRVYEQRPAVWAIIHGHDPLVLRRAADLGLPVTRVTARVNSAALIRDVVRLAARTEYVLLREHGFIALGSSLQAAEMSWRRWWRLARS